MRFAHVENNDEGTLERFADAEIAADTHVVTDGHAGYNKKSLGERTHECRPRHSRRENDAVQSLDDLSVEVMARRHACGRGARQAPAGLSR